MPRSLLISNPFLIAGGEFCAQMCLSFPSDNVNLSGAIPNLLCLLLLSSVLAWGGGQGGKVGVMMAWDSQE